MGWYLRKAFSFGPLRINLSKSGVGWSVGRRGLRYGQNARGQRYIHAGTGGIYYRQSLGGPAAATPTAPKGLVATTPTTPISGLVPQSPLAALVTRAQQLVRWDRVVAMSAAILSLLALLTGVATALAVLTVGLIGWYLAYLWEIRRRVITIEFGTLSPADRRIFTDVTHAVGKLALAERLWAITGSILVTGPAVRVNAGAGALTERAPLVLTDVEPDWVQTKLEVLNLRTRSWHLSFLPTGLLLVRNRVASFATYNQTSVYGQQVRFVDRDPAGDSPVTGKTWSIVNKDGSPDRRYSRNPELSVSEIGQVKIVLAGATVEFQVSNPTAAKAFVDDFVLALAEARRCP